MKSAAPWMIVALTFCSPKRATTPMITAATRKSAASSGKDQPSSNPYAVASASPVTALDHGTTEKIMKVKTRATSTRTVLWRGVRSGGSPASAAVWSRSPGRKPESERPGSLRTRRAYRMT